VWSTPLPSPGLGQADLSSCESDGDPSCDPNCERERIRLAAAIRPYGALLSVSEPDLRIVQASANAAQMLNWPGELLGQTLDALGGDLAQRVREGGAQALAEVPAAVRCSTGRAQGWMDGLLHRPCRQGLVVELIPAGPPMDLSAFVCDALRSISGTSSLHTLCDETARIFKDLAGYDRVTIHRFDAQGHGEVLSEERAPARESFLGNRYPASNFPEIARRLYIRTRITVLEDAGYAPVPLMPACSPLDGQPLDLSMCYLRSMSPVHVQYLRNMGVAATLVTSLVVGGRLWGLISCHHYSPRSIRYQVRVVCELLAEAIATRISALQSFAQAQAELSVRRLEHHMIQAISRRGDWEHALFENPELVLQPLGASGGALYCDGKVTTAGDVPGTPQLNALRRWLDAQPRVSAIATASLGARAPQFARLAPVASGLLAVPLSGGLGEYLVWFRPERVRTLTGGGNPYEAVEVGGDPTQLAPRRPFPLWHRAVEGTCDAWAPEDLATARLMGESVADVIQQFRSLRVLVARDQLQDISGKVQRSGQPVAIADAKGAIVLANDAFSAILSTGSRPQTLNDLRSLFLEDEEATRGLSALVDRHRPWRGEVVLQGRDGVARPFLVRADPVLSAPEQVLGFVLLLADLRERKLAEAARRRFQTGVVERHRVTAEPVDSQADLRRRDLLASVVGNAQLAALEITDGPDLTRVPEMLESIESSVTRATELLGNLLSYSNHLESGQ
jgi:chemotaxis family two-component system sensor kinase Cph1